MSQFMEREPRYAAGKKAEFADANLGGGAIGPGTLGGEYANMPRTAQQAQTVQSLLEAVSQTHAQVHNLVNHIADLHGRIVGMPVNHTLGNNTKDNDNPKGETFRIRQLLANVQNAVDLGHSFISELEQSL